MEAAQATEDEHKELLLLQAVPPVLRRDEAAVQAALAAAALLRLHGVSALHIAALADWGSGVQMLLGAGGR